MIAVVDASALIDALFGVEGLIDRLRMYELHAPARVDAEVLHGTRRRLLGELIDIDEADTVVETFQTPALAESLNAPLLTRDRRLSRSSGHAARIKYID